MRIVGSNNWVDELPPAVRAELRECQVLRELPAGETIATAGEPARFVYQVVNGCVKLVSDVSSGERVLLAIYIRGNCFTETAVVSARKLRHTTVAAMPSTIAYLSTEDFHRLFLKHPEISQALCRKFALTISRSVLFRDVKADASLTEQLRIVFQNLAENTGRQRPDGKLEIPVPLTISELSSFLGVTRQTMQKEISLYKGLNLVWKEQGLWIVGNLTRLDSLGTTSDFAFD